MWQAIFQRCPLKTLALIIPPHTEEDTALKGLHKWNQGFNSADLKIKEIILYFLLSLQ
jgi:hypothetical protein